MLSRFEGYNSLKYNAITRQGEETEEFCFVLLPACNVLSLKLYMVLFLSIVAYL